MGNNLSGCPRNRPQSSSPNEIILKRSAETIWRGIEHNGGHEPLNFVAAENLPQAE
jgi:hypothetical protein